MSVSADAQRVLDYSWLHDDQEEDLVGAEWHQSAIRALATSLKTLADARAWPWHVGDQVTLLAWKPDGTAWRPAPDIAIYPRLEPEERREIDVRVEGPRPRHRGSKRLHLDLRCEPGARRTPKAGGQGVRLPDRTERTRVPGVRPKGRVRHRPVPGLASGWRCRAGMAARTRWALSQPGVRHFNAARWSPPAHLRPGWPARAVLVRGDAASAGAGTRGCGSSC